MVFKIASPDPYIGALQDFITIAAICHLILDYSPKVLQSDIAVQQDIQDILFAEGLLLEGYIRYPCVPNIPDIESWWELESGYYYQDKEFYYPCTELNIIFSPGTGTEIFSFTCYLLEEEDTSCTCYLCEQTRGNTGGCSLYDHYHQDEVYNREIASLDCYNSFL